MPRLNRIADANLRNSLEFETEILSNLRSADAPTDHAGLVEFSENRGYVARSVALYRYALYTYSEGGDPDELAALFAGAASDFALSLSLRPPPDESSSRSPWQAESYLCLIACFGDDEAAAQAASLEPWQYRFPARPETEDLARYLSHLCGAIDGADFDPVLLASIAAAAGVPNADRENRLFLAPAASGLIAIHSGDERAWNAAIAKLVAAHKEDALRGQLRLLPQGMIAMTALMVAKFGLDAGLKCTIESDYLPLFLLDL
jgi:hypothetical protein